MSGPCKHCDRIYEVRVFMRRVAEWKMLRIEKDGMTYGRDIFETKRNKKVFWRG